MRNSDKLDLNSINLRKLRVALVYDRVNKWGGAERVLLALHKIFPKAPLYTSVYNKKSSPWADEFAVKTSFLQTASALRKYNELLAIFMPIAFEHFSFNEYDLVISVSSESAKGIITSPKTIHIAYCLTPTRYLWSLYQDYFSNKLIRFLSKGSVSYLRSWDKAAAQRPDHFIAISSEVQRRIKKYYQRESEIIFPPLMIEKPKGTLRPASQRGEQAQGKQNYFLFVSRFSRFSYYKRGDLVIEAFNKSGLPLKIVGSGPMLGKLKPKAKKNIEFLGELTDIELAYYYENCIALVFPGNEDFGLVMAEAQSYGAPVIAFRGGGALDIVQEGKTGEFFLNQDADSLVNALKRFDERRYNKFHILRNSQRFSFENFKRSFEKLIKEKVKL